MSAIRWKSLYVSSVVDSATGGFRLSIEIEHLIGDDVIHLSFEQANAFLAMVDRAIAKPGERRCLPAEGE